MPPVSGSAPGPAGQAADNDYDNFAEAYSAVNEVSLLNAYYERPATLALAGNVAGRRILDAGCGSGPLFAALRDRGAVVTGLDKSAGMLELARRRLGDDADLHLADLSRPLPFPDGAFDDVIASLVLHYLQDWTPAAARHDQRLHHGRLPDSRHRRTAPSARHPPRTATRLPQGRAPNRLPVLPVLRPGGRLTDALKASRIGVSGVRCPDHGR